MNCTGFFDEAANVVAAFAANVFAPIKTAISFLCVGRVTRQIARRRDGHLLLPNIAPQVDPVFRCTPRPSLQAHCEDKNARLKRRH